MVIRDRTTEQHQISLGGRKFRTRGNPQRRLISQFPGKVTLGDWTNESNPLASVKSWTDRRGGIGTENADIERGQDRTWFSTATLRHNKHHVLQRRSVATAANSGIGTDETVQFVAELGSSVYSIAGSKTYRYADSDDTWSANLNSFASAPTDVLTCPLNGVETLIVAQSGAAVDSTADGTTWTDETSTTTDVSFITWDVARGYVWGIDTSGNTYFTSNLTNGWTQTATMRLTRGVPTKLFMGPGPSDEDLLYAATQIGLYVYDNANERWVATKLTLPFHDQNGTGSTVFRDSIYVNAGLAVYKYVPDTQTIITLVGPDRDDGIPQNYQGATRSLAGTHTELMLLIDGSNTSGTSDFTAGGTFTDGIHTSQRLGSGGGLSSIMSFNEIGWEFEWTSTTAGQVSTANLLVSNTYNSYRLWWGSNETIYFMTLPVGIENPNQVANTQREPSSTTQEPWFDAGVDNQTRTALSWIIDSNHPSTSETITLKYQLDFDESDSATITMQTKKESGVMRFELPGREPRVPSGFDFPDRPIALAQPGTGLPRFLPGLGRIGFTRQSEDESGVPFRAIRPIIDMSRGSILTNTPDLKRLSLVFLKRITGPLWGWDILINMTREEQGYYPDEQRDFLESLLNPEMNGDKLQQFTYKDEEDNDQNFWVMVLAASADENTGHDDGSFWRITVAEPR